jgi:hypothetical protein
MPEYKSIKCELCNKSYLNNYFYTHKKSKIHLKKMVQDGIKQELLKDDKIIVEDDNNIDLLINNIQINIEKIKNIIAKN